MKRQIIIATIIAASLSAPLAATDQQADQLDFLVGEWSGSGSGEPGQGTGSFSFARDLQGRILVRHAHSEYPATENRPATVHDDLLIVYSGGSEALYFDNEGHVIHYKITVDPQAKTATFLSTDPQPAPAFRLTYKQRSADQLQVGFEISPSGKVVDFKTYLNGVVTRAKPAPK